MFKSFIGLLCFVHYGQAFIVPQELPSILSLVYSNIPPIKKGTDSRVGFGYRLGEHADFQVLFELGPQTNTKPIGNAATDPSSDTSKRQVEPEDYTKKLKPPMTQGNKYLDSWSQDMKKKNKKVIRQEKDEMPNYQHLPTMPFISDSALRQLQQLYGNKQQQNDVPLSESIGTLPAASLDSSTSAETKQNFRIVIPTNSAAAGKPKSKITEDLMDVGLD